MSDQSTNLEWTKVLELDELDEGRVTTVTAGTTSLCMTKFEGQYGALDNRCPHQGGPLGEGSIENGLLRCPWHGWDYHPCTGIAPGFDDGVDTFPIDIRDDGIYVGMVAEPEHQPTVSDLMVETMINWGVTHVFGMVGHSNLGFADAMRRAEAKGKLTYIGIRHEGAAAFAASAYGKLTGELAACFSIAGPGATNLLTGLYDAKVDRAPVLALTGQVDTQVLGPGAFQEIDQIGAFKDVAAFSQPVLPGSRHVELMNLACKNALLKRDVGHLILPDEVQEMPAPEGATAGDPAGRRTPVTITPPAESLAEARDLLSLAKRPVIIVGHGARFAMDAITALAEHCSAPVLTTFKAKGLISDSHPLGCGVLGRSGTPIASYFMNEADLLLVFGASFSNHTGITPKIPTIQVDFDAMALGKFHPVTCPVWGEIDVTVRAMLEGLSGNWDDRRPQIADRWAIWRAEKARREVDDHGQGIGSAAVFAALGQAADDDAVIAIDVGNNAYAFGRYFECQRHSVLMSGYLGSIGFALPAAMGAWAAVKGSRQVISVSGDGGLGQYGFELTTLVHYQINITHVLLNNQELGKISKEQRGAELDVWQTSLTNPNFSEFATSCGALGIRVTELAELAPALERALAHAGPALVEVMTDALLV